MFKDMKICLVALSMVGALAVPVIAQDVTSAETEEAGAETEVGPEADAAPNADLEMLTFSAGQAAGGRLVYQRECAVCHGNDLGGGAGPTLVGESFSYWIGQPVSELHQYIHEFMPAGAPGSLSPAQVTTIIAYLAERNGLEAGGEPLPIEIEEQENIAFDQ